MVFSEIQKDKHVLWIHELYTSLKTLLKFLQRLVEHETFSASKTKERIQHQSIGHVNHRSTVFTSMDRELIIIAAAEDSNGNKEMNTEYTETSMEMLDL